MNLTIRQWTGRKLDREETREVNSKHGTHAARVTKQLVSKAALNKIQAKLSELRAYHYKMTLPWGDNGDRLLPNNLYMDYVKRFSELKLEAEEEIENFVTEYNEHIIRARNELGTLYNPDDYPTTDTIRRKFAIEMEVTPMQEVTDFRSNLVNEETISEIRQEIATSIASRHEKAMGSMVERMREVVQNMIERIERKEENPSARFHESTISAIEELISLLPEMNYTNDIRISRMVAELNQLIVDPEAIREDSETRREYLRRAKAVNNMLVF